MIEISDTRDEDNADISRLYHVATENLKIFQSLTDPKLSYRYGTAFNNSVKLLLETVKDAEIKYNIWADDSRQDANEIGITNWKNIQN